MSKLFYILIFTSVCVIQGFSQTDKKILTYGDVIELAKTQSVAAVQAKSKFKNSYWEYHIYKSEKLPTLAFTGILPNANKAISRITVPNGQDIFIERKYTSWQGGLSLSQNIPYTGGNFSLNSSLQQLQFFGSNGFTNYLANPISVGINQPLFTFNNYKWESKIEPLKYKEAKKQYIEEVEEISIKATNLFFDLLTAQAKLKTSQLNQANNDTLYRISIGRYQLGKIAENELLQMELNLLNANNTLAQAKIDLQVKAFRLKSFLGIKDNAEIELSAAQNIHYFFVDLIKAQSEAIANRSDMISFRRQLLEASREVARSKNQNRFAVNLVGSYGLSQTDSTLERSYNNPLEQQQINVGVQIPILDWGKSKARIRMAQANRELMTANVEQAQKDFEQEIFLKVMQFNMQKEKVTIATKADTVADKRFQIAKQRYFIGKIDITDLSIAQQQKDESRASYFEALRTYWINYYELRRITLYDFDNNKPVDISIEKNIR